MWVRGNRSLKVIETGTIWKLWYCLLFAFHSNYGCIVSHFGDISRQRMAWLWNLGLELFKVIENGAVRQTMYDFLLVRHCNYILYRLRVIWRWILEIFIHNLLLVELFDVDYRDLESRVRVCSRSLVMTPFDRSHTSSYLPSMPLSCIVCHI